MKKIRVIIILSVLILSLNVQTNNKNFGVLGLSVSSVALLNNLSNAKYKYGLLSGKLEIPPEYVRSDK